MNRNLSRLTLGLAALAVVMVGLESQADARGRRCHRQRHHACHSKCCETTCCETPCEEPKEVKCECECACEQECCDSGRGHRRHKSRRHHDCGCDSGCGCNGGEANHAEPAHENGQSAPEAPAEEGRNGEEAPSA